MHRFPVVCRIMPVCLWCDDIPGLAVYLAEQFGQGVASFNEVVVLLNGLAVNAIEDFFDCY